MIETAKGSDAPTIPLGGASPGALRDFWNVLQANRAAVDDAIMVAAREVPLFAQIIEAMDERTHEAQRTQSHALERAALLEQSWDAYMDHLRQQGMAYAQMGVNFGDWFKLLHTYRSALLPGMFEAFGAEPHRLQCTIEAMTDFLDLAMATIGDAYIVTKEEMIRAQQAQLAQHVADLERSNKDLDEFAYVASHDLRAPLRDVDNLAQWIVEDVGDSLPAASVGHLTKLQERVSRMDRFLDDLLQYSRAGRRLEEPATLDLAEVIEDVRALIVVPDGFRLQWPLENPRLKTSRVALAQVLRNLVQNAIKHHDRPEGMVEIRVASSGSWLRFTIRDDGPGIPQEFHQRVFRMFQTLRPRDDVEGSGMGLALVKKLVEAHGGTVSLASGPGRGSSFTFSWPQQWDRSSTSRAPSDAWGATG